MASRKRSSSGSAGSGRGLYGRGVPRGGRGGSSAASSPRQVLERRQKLGTGLLEREAVVDQRPCRGNRAGNFVDRLFEIGIVLGEGERALVKPERFAELTAAMVDLRDAANGRQILGRALAARSSSSACAASRSLISMSARPSVTRAERYRDGSPARLGRWRSRLRGSRPAGTLRPAAQTQSTPGPSGPGVEALQSRIVRHGSLFHPRLRVLRRR